VNDLPPRLTDASAAALGRAVAHREVSSVEVVRAHLDQIDTWDSRYHAFVSRREPDLVLAEARARDAELAAGNARGWLHGIPHAVKDLSDVAGLPTTAGFLPPSQATTATADALFVERVRRAGAVFVGKTNTPEFGLGSHTYNGVGPTTLNAYDPRLAAGGSSGGAAVAVATGMVPVADGSDFMGSLRNPPGWNGVLALRPTPGVVPDLADDPFASPGGVVGPIARAVEDLALLLATMAGYDRRTPMASRDDPARLVKALGDVVGPPRIGWLGDLDGYLPTEPGVLNAGRAALERWTAVGATVQDASLPRVPGYRGTDELWPAWLTFRHQQVGGRLLAIYRDENLRARMKPEARWEVEGYLGLTVSDLDRAAATRAGLLRAFLALFDDFDVVVLPTAQVWPFPAEQHWPTTVAGVEMDTYHRWMEITTLATLVGLPVLVLPAGSDSRGLPLGLQLIAAAHAEPQLLAWGQAAQQARVFTVALPSRVVHR
jgi:amidase